MAALVNKATNAMPQYRLDVSQESHTNNHSFSKNWTTEADFDSIVPAPGSKKSIFLKDAIISNGDTAGYFRLVQDPVDSTASIIASRLNLGIDAYTSLNFSQPHQLTPNAALLVDSTTADDFSVSVSYYIDEVTGFGYTSGGYTGTTGLSTVQENFFASDSSSTVGADIDMIGFSSTIYGGAGASSATHGYVAGGFTSGYNRAQISKFSFSSTANATYNGDLTTAIRYNSGFFSISNGYSSGGYSNEAVNQISRYSFSSDANSILVGELAVALYGAAAQQSSTAGYTSGGFATDEVSTISKYSFLSDGTAVSIGDLTVARSHTTGQSSVEKGYTSGGWNDPTYYNTVDAFSYASEANAADIGDLTVARYGAAGQSSSINGYTSGGTTGTATKTIDKASFSAGGNSASVGDLVTACSFGIGQQSN